MPVAGQVARSLFFVLVTFLGLVPHGWPTPPQLEPAAVAELGRFSERDVVLAGDLSDEDRIVFTAALAASGHPGVLLLDSGRHGKSVKQFLETYRPERLLAVGRFEEPAELEERLGMKPAMVLPFSRGPPEALWRWLFPRAERVVVCPAQPRGVLLQSACLAGALQAPLYVFREGDNVADLKRCLNHWGTREVFAVGVAVEACTDLALSRLVRLGDEDSVRQCYLRLQHARGPIETLVVANPADGKKGYSPLSTLAPWLAIQRRAALLLTGPDGDNAASLIKDAIKDPRLERAETLLLFADLLSLPMERRPNPIPGKDPYIEMEPLTPTGNEPFSFSTGRLFHEDPAVVMLVLARQRLLAPRHRLRQAESALVRRDAGPLAHGPPRLKALVASNPGGSLPMLELFSRHTAKELANCGFETTGLFGHDVCRDELRRLLPEHDIFLWEGHHSTLIKDYAFPEWNEPLRPSFMFLQSCLVLTEEKALPLLHRGAVGIVGSSTRTYSASGGAFSLAYFDALLYDGQSLGGSLRHAKNFLIAYLRLKEKRLGKEARLLGANLRSAWAFTLWGDPALHLPVPVTADHDRPPVRHQVKGNTLVLSLPEQSHARVATRRYQAQMPPNARLGGLLSKDPSPSSRCLTPLLFAEVRLPRPTAGQVPRLRTRLPDDSWVFTWDARRSCGYLLALPTGTEKREIRFQIDWITEEGEQPF